MITIEEGTETHYYFNEPHFYAYVSKEKWNNLMREEGVKCLIIHNKNNVLFTCLDGVEVLSEEQNIYFIDEYISERNCLCCSYKHLVTAYNSNEISKMKIYGSKENAMEYLNNKLI